jgi:predicted PurR-regulated permease PerM
MEKDQDNAGSFLQLSRRQQNAVAAAMTLVAVVVILAAVLGFGWLVSAFMRRFSNVFLPLAVGAIAALVFSPYYKLVHSRLPAVVALIIVFASILIPLVAFTWFFGTLAVEQISDLITKFPEWWKSTFVQLKERWPKVLEFLETNPWGQRLQKIVEGQKETLVSGLQVFGGKALSVGALLLGSVVVVVSWAVLPIYFAFFLMAEPKALRDPDHLLPFLKPETRKDVVYLVSEFVNMIVAFFRGQLIIAFLQGLLYAVAFSLVGLRYGFVLGLVLGFLNIIPYLGSMIGLGAGLPLAYFQQGGGPMLVVWVLVIFTVVQLIESYLLTPKIMGQRTGLHPIAIIVAIFFWGSALEGILGMILAIPLTAFLVVFWRLAKDKYIGELV